MEFNPSNNDSGSQNCENASRPTSWPSPPTQSSQYALVQRQIQQQQNQIPQRRQQQLQQQLQMQLQLRQQQIQRSRPNTTIRHSINNPTPESCSAYTSRGTEDLGALRRNLSTNDRMDFEDEFSHMVDEEVISQALGNFEVDDCLRIVTSQGLGVPSSGASMVGLTHSSSRQRCQGANHRHHLHQQRPYHSVVSTSSTITPQDSAAGSRNSIQDFRTGNSPTRKQSVSRISVSTLESLDNCSNLTAEQREQLIRKIHADPTIAPSEKSKIIQSVFAGRFTTKRQLAFDFVKRNLESKEREVTYQDEATKILGCKHYQRSCKLKAKCCGRFVTCRLCHDEELDHKINRFETESVLCMVCGTEQPVAKKCVCCDTIFARYFCEICKFYDNTPGKEMYHCKDCGICRVGKGLGIDNFHCKRCNACVSLESKQRHHCLENSLQSDCPICAQFLFTSTSPVVFMRCGHTMHSSCFKQYTEVQHHYTCPICSRSLADMSDYYRKLDSVVEVERNNLPEELRNRISYILCNDCGRKGDAPYHCVHHKCLSCGSYNTRVLATRNSDTRPAIALNAST